jgi:hypothetical protein
MATITDKQAKEILEKYTGEYGQQSKIAREYKVSLSLVNRIVHRKNWTHIL